VKKPVWLVIFLLVGGASALIYFSMRPADMPETHVVTIGSIRRQTRGLGRVEGLAEVSLVFGRPGQIAALSAVEGMDVEEGAVIAEQNSAELDTRIEVQKAQLRQAEAKLAKAKNPLPPEVVKQAEDKWKEASKEVETSELRLKYLKNPSVPPPGTQYQIEEAGRKIDGFKQTLTLAQVALDKLKAGPSEIEKAQANQEVDAANTRLKGAENVLRDYKKPSAFSSGADNKTKLEADVDLARSELKKAELQRDKVCQPPNPLDISSAEARVKQAQLDVDGAEAAKAALITPVALPAAPPNVIAEAELALKQAQLREAQARHFHANTQRGPEASEIAAAQAAKEEAEQSLELLRLHREGLKLIAPFAGRVVKRHVEPGSTVNAFAPIVTIVNLKRKRVRCEFDVAGMLELSNRIGLAQKDAKQESTVELKSKAFKEPIPGRLEKLNGVGVRKLNNEDPSAPKGGEVLEVLVLIDEPQSALQKESYDLLFPGIRMEVAVTLEKRDNVLIIPKSYVMTENSEEFVLIKTSAAPGSTETARRKIKCGLRDEQNVEILANLTESDLIVKPKPANGGR
jgi:multidrug efflux pump subunit AcrA (membrane-fusion protein)